MHVELYWNVTFCIFMTRKKLQKIKHFSCKSTFVICKCILVKQYFDTIRQISIWYWSKINMLCCSLKLFSANIITQPSVKHLASDDLNLGIFSAVFKVLIKFHI